MLDYTVGVLLIAAPWISQFADETSAGKWISIIVGVVIILTSSVTNYEGGFLGHAVPMRMHSLADAVIGIFLAVSPWLFGFADQGANAWLPFLLIGLAELDLAAMTNPMPGDRFAAGTRGTPNKLTRVRAAHCPGRRWAPSPAPPSKRREFRQKPAPGRRRVARPR